MKVFPLHGDLPQGTIPSGEILPGEPNPSPIWGELGGGNESSERSQLPCSASVAVGKEQVAAIAIGQHCAVGRPSCIGDQQTADPARWAIERRQPPQSAWLEQF